MHTYTHMYMNTHTHACTHARTHARTHACTHARTHGCAHNKLWESEVTYVQNLDSNGTHDLHVTCMWPACDPHVAHMWPTCDVHVTCMWPASDTPEWPRDYLLFSELEPIPPQHYICENLAMWHSKEHWVTKKWKMYHLTYISCRKSHTSAEHEMSLPGIEKLGNFNLLPPSCMGLACEATRGQVSLQIMEGTQKPAPKSTFNVGQMLKAYYTSTVSLASLCSQKVLGWLLCQPTCGTAGNFYEGLMFVMFAIRLNSQKFHFA